jgi:hypothetical protein
MWTSLYYGYWDYWELRHEVTFDGANKLIRVNDGITNLDVQIDVYSAWKQWLALDQNTKFLPALNTVGGEPTIAGQKLDVTYFLINGWKLKPFPGQYNLDIIGNLFDVDGGDIKVPADVVANDPNNITINLNTSVIVRQVDSGTSSGSFDPDTIVSASLFGAQETSLYNIEGVVLDIQNTLSNPITASLDVSQSLQLDIIESLSISQSQQLSTLTNINYSQSLQLVDLQDKLFEVWQLHGLDITEPLTVTQTARVFGDVDQTITTTGTGSSQETIIIRNP